MLLAARNTCWGVSPNPVQVRQTRTITLHLPAAIREEQKAQAVQAGYFSLTKIK